MKDAPTPPERDHLFAGNLDRLTVVYVLGTSYSGSTYLSMLVGSDPQVFFVGELKLFDEFPIRVCSCGSSAHNCPLWGQVHRSLTDPVWVDRGSGVSFSNLRLLAKAMLCGRKGLSRVRPNRRYLTLLSTLDEVIGRIKPSSELLLDNSKSLSPLASLLSASDIDTKILFSSRSLSGVLRSARKRSRPRSSAFLGWIAMEIVSWRLRRGRDCEILRVNHDRVVNHRQRELARINKFLGTSLDDHQIDRRVSDERYHVPSKLQVGRTDVHA